MDKRLKMDGWMRRRMDKRLMMASAGQVRTQPTFERATLPGVYVCVCVRQTFNLSPATILCRAISVMMHRLIFETKNVSIFFPPHICSLSEFTKPTIPHTYSCRNPLCVQGHPNVQPCLRRYTRTSGSFHVICSGFAIHLKPDCLVSSPHHKQYIITMLWF